MICDCQDFCPLTRSLMRFLDTKYANKDVFEALSKYRLGDDLKHHLFIKYEHNLINKSEIVSEMKKISVIEENLFKATLKGYIKAASAAVKSATRVLSKYNVYTESSVYDALKSADRIFHKRFPTKTLINLNRKGVKDIYKLSQQAVLKKHMKIKGYNSLLYKSSPSIRPNFSLADQRAMEYLADSQQFWISDASIWTDADDLIRQISLENLQGLTPEQASTRLFQELEKRYGIGASGLARGAAYWEGVVVNAATTARVAGSIYEMSELGVTRYEIMNPMDSRTSKVCQMMNGKVMEITDAVSILDELVEAADPLKIKDLHPWHGNNFGKVMSDAGVDARVGRQFPEEHRERLARAGFAFPPFHFRCRSTVDISTE